MEKRCPGCMKLKNQSPVCEHCGYNENVPNYPHQLPIGTVLQGRYQVGKVLGQGGFGITYIGWDMSLEAAGAVKEYYPASFVNRDCNQTLSVSCNGEGAEALFRHNRERFLKEARILARLQNVPGIVRVQNLFAENNTAYIVMEYVEGIDLKHYIRLQGRVLTSGETFHILRPVMYALSKVHEAELVHRDISPDNIMILPDGTAKLLDFGAAREVEDAGVDKELPQSTEAILKHGFAPIEQYRRRGSLGPWTDVYALCATMYYCLTGKVPNSAPERITDDDNVNWRQVSGLTEGQMTILEQGMTIMPKNRVRSMEQLYRGLFADAGQPTVSKAPTSKPQDYPSQTLPLDEKSASPVVMETKPKKKKKTAPILAAAVLAVVAAVGLFAMKPKAEDDTSALPEIFPAATETTEAVVLSEEEILYREATALEADGQLGKAAIAFGKLGDYTDARERSFAIWEKITPRGSLVSNGCAIRSDGTVVHMNPARQEATAHWRDIVKTYGALGLKADGTVLITTFNGNVPELDVSGWRDIVDIAPGSCNYSIQTSPNSWYGHNSSYLLGLKADGTVIAIGDNNWGHCDVSGWTDIVAIATGSFTGKNTHTYPIEPRTLGDATYDTAQTEKIYYSVGIKADGTIVTAGKIPESWDLSEWMDIIKVSIYEDHMAGLRSDGTVVSTQYDVSDWKNITDIDAGPYHLLGLRSDGTVAAIGNVHMYGHLDVEDWTDIVAISATDRLTVGLKADGTVVDVGHYESEGDRNASSWSDIVAIATAPTAMIYGLKADGTVVSQHKNAVFTDVKMPTKTLPVRNSNGTKPEASSVLSGNVLSPDWQEIIVSKADYRPFESLTQIEYITFLDTQEDSPERTWDVSENHDGSVLAWVEPTNNNARFHLYIAAEGGVNAPEDSSMLFADERAVMRNLQTIHFGDAFHTGNVTNMSRMFDNCLARSLDVSDFDTSRVTDMSAMFRFCHNLTSLDLSNFDTSNVTDMDFMFWYFSSFTSLELGEFDTSSVTSYKNFMEEGMTVNGQPWKELFNH